MLTTITNPRTLLAATLIAAVASTAPVSVQVTGNEETARSVRKMLERLPYYGVFDYLAFNVDRGVVTLMGFDYHGTLKDDAERAARRTPGIVEVANRIETLPASANDDRARWATFYRIYTDDFLSRYAPGGRMAVIHDIIDQRRFPGMQPVGMYPIHIVVKNGRVMLLGTVDSASDRQLAEVRAREVTGVFVVENSLTVVR